jgi:malto-oligosyltrehalose synthase/4-alpha-glucanotransferase
MYQPESTYRVQFHKDFTFNDLEQITPYLHGLGIKTIYASPVFEAIPGSTHGYDGINPNAINAEIGTLEQLYKIAEKLKVLGMGWVQDFVPNHMAYSSQNEWLCDYLEKGKMSAYDSYFDKNPDEPLMAPFLGSELYQALDSGEIRIVFSGGKLQFSYFDQLFPLNYTGYSDVLDHEIFDGKGFDGVRKELDRLSQAIDKSDFQNQWNVMVQSLSAIGDQQLPVFLQGLETINEDKMLLHRINDMQFYRLCNWRETNTRINYRRFFTINGLICINIQQQEVFDDYHRLLQKLVLDNVFQGVRIDHIDGLYDPETYLKRLRSLLGDDVYIVVEKILERDEQLPLAWPVQGTTGYDFLAEVNNLLTGTTAATAFDEMYEKLSAGEIPPSGEVEWYKKMILDKYMQGELDNLVVLFSRVQDDGMPEDISLEATKDLIAELLICCPVYRYYPRALPLSAEEAKAFDLLVAAVDQRGQVSMAVTAYFKKCFTNAGLLQDRHYRERLLHFWRRFMQLSGPLMAKGVEDTQMYNNQKFLAHNEVGDSLSYFGMSHDAFHELMISRQEQFPLSMNATATHDTKRGEDSRARLQLLSKYHKAWFEYVKSWISSIPSADDKLTIGDKYFVIQVIYSSLGLEPDDDSYTDRLKAYLTKAAREAKTRSGWDDPDEAYEAALLQFAMDIYNPKGSGGKGIRNFLKEHESDIAKQSLAQLVLKCTCPGIPDIYQGTEFWDTSFVDPDNRRAVDYGWRTATLSKIKQEGFKVRDLTESLTDPGCKLFCLLKMLSLRKALPDVFTKGLYQPVKTTEAYFSFVRRYGADWVWVVISLAEDGDDSDAAEILPPIEAPVRWQNIFTGQVTSVTELNIKEQLKQFPVAVFQAQSVNQERRAGILLPLFSLPSVHGIGDMGAEAYSFISFLSLSGQKLWQILPLNPVLAENFFSPYACSSAFARDPMYVDLNGLVQEGLLTDADIIPIELPATRAVDYSIVRENKLQTLTVAWQKARAVAWLYDEFNAFCKQEQEWLEDYALYSVIKKEHEGKPWYEWPEIYSSRSEDHLRIFKASRTGELELQRWMQFVFFRQWNKLRAFAQQHNVRLVGDIPFYVSHDSVDVWANQHLFALDPSGKMQVVAGVPPDYFSATGQLWGMPVYHWAEHQKQGYHWWLQRLQQNIRLFDIVRLDHFRAFYDYWEIPGDATTAINGAWRKGPQDELFRLMQQHFPAMPFIAEDLGEIHKGVFDFKDKYRLPGMRVLQFGFEHYNGVLRDLPHNFNRNSVVYTGTHDNNTAVGWYDNLEPAARKALSDYAGFEVNVDNVAETMIRLAYSTVADTLIIPVQDVLSLDEANRINTPSTTDNNWKWRMLPGELTDNHSLWLLQFVRRYNR